MYVRNKNQIPCRCELAPFSYYMKQTIARAVKENVSCTDFWMDAVEQHLVHMWYNKSHQVFSFQTPHADTQIYAPFAVVLLLCQLVTQLLIETVSLHVCVLVTFKHNSRLNRSV